LIRSSRRLVTVLAAATVVSTLAACGGGGGGGGGGSGDNEASDTGITADSIKIGATYPLTGVAAPGYSEIPTGVQAYFDYVNDNGGVNGRKIDYVFKDDGYNPTPACSTAPSPPSTSPGSTPPTTRGCSCGRRSGTPRARTAS